jgi:hypothetical protein
MHRSNLIQLLLGILFIATLALIWIWIHDFNQRLRMWASWGTVTYASATGFLIWLRALRYSRLIGDIPTSRVATAAQGYIELCGRAAQFEDQQAKSVAGLPVLWFRREYAERSDSPNRYAIPFNLFYTPTETEESQTPFAIDDGTGVACILPHGAEIICEREDVRYNDNRRVTEELILPGDSLYVIGDFSTHTLQPPLDELAYERTRQWERNPARRRMFDMDKDGRLSQAEWLAMHEAAKIAVLSDSNPGHPEGAKHLIFEPNDGRAFLISSVPPERLAGRYRFYLVIGLVLFLGGGTVSLTMVFGQLLN